MSTSLFNEAILNASVISQGKEVFDKLMAEKFSEWIPKVKSHHYRHFTLAMATYNELAVEAVKTGNPEMIVDLVEQFRLYEPMFESTEYGLFDQKCFNFKKRLVEVSFSTYLGDPEKFAEVSKPFIELALLYAKTVQSIRVLLDKNALEKLIRSWNKAAEEWKQVIDKTFPTSNLPSNAVSDMGY